MVGQATTVIQATLMRMAARGLGALRRAVAERVTAVAVAAVVAATRTLLAAVPAGHSPTQAFLSALRLSVRVQDPKASAEKEGRWD